MCRINRSLWWLWSFRRKCHWSDRKAFVPARMVYVVIIGISIPQQVRHQAWFLPWIISESFFRFVCSRQGPAPEPCLNHTCYSNSQTLGVEWKCWQKSRRHHPATQYGKNVIPQWHQTAIQLFLKAGVILYFSYGQQIPQKDTKQQWCSLSLFPYDFSTLCCTQTQAHLFLLKT